MANGIKYSIIIPIYNAEKTLRRCLDSIACQLRDDVQIVLINDGSQDLSEAIAMEYVQKNPAFQVITQKNSGVSRARNTGLEVAKGEYVMFVDSDDYVRSDYFSILDQNEDCDLLVFCHEIIGDDPRNMAELFAQLREIESHSQRLELLLSSRRIMSPWDKRFKRSIIEANRIRFPEEMQIGEDFNFCMAYAVQCRVINIETSSIIYNDITGQDSLSRKYRPDLARQMLAAFAKAAAAIQDGPQPRELKKRLLAHTDYLFAKLTFSCIAEKFKAGDLRYLKDRKEIADICQQFRTPLSDDRCNVIHTALRFLLRYRLYFPFYLVSRIAKRRRYLNQVKG